MRKEKGVRAIICSCHTLCFRFFTFEVRRAERGVWNADCGKTGPGRKSSFWSQKGSVKGGTTVTVMYRGS